jgi:hypothetical protein
MEKAVAALPSSHAAAIRWCYVYRGNPIEAAQNLATTKQGLFDLIERGRTMLINQGLYKKPLAAA